MLAVFRKLTYTTKEKATLGDTDGFFLAIKAINIAFYNRLYGKKNE